MNKGKKLRQLLSGEGCVAMPGCYDALSARVIETMGFSAMYMTGNGVCASTLGLPDLGLITMSELLERARAIANCTDIPILCDADTGFGDVLHVARTAEEFSRAGIAAIHLEDQTFTKRCVAHGGVSLIDALEMAQKIKAAAGAKADPNFMVIGRSDSKEYGIDEVKRRLHMYLDAGADMVILSQTYTHEELEDFGREFYGRLIGIGGVACIDTYNLPLEEFGRMGFKGVIYPSAAQGAAVRAMQRTLTPLLEKGQMTSEFLRENIYDIPELNRIVRFDEYLDMQEEMLNG